MDYLADQYLNTFIKSILLKYYWKILFVFQKCKSLFFFSNFQLSSFWSSEDLADDTSMSNLFEKVWSVFLWSSAACLCPVHISVCYEFVSQETIEM